MLCIAAAKCGIKHDFLQHLEILTWNELMTMGISSYSLGEESIHCNHLLNNAMSVSILLP